MGALRKKWTDAKDLAKFAFQKQPVPREVTLQAHESGLPSFPLKFDKDLGPALDSFEKAKAAKKADDIKKYSDKIKSAVTIYNKRIADSKELGKDAKLILDKALGEISRSL